MIACVQMRAIEFHGWSTVVGAVETPDQMVFDLDPDEGLAFTETRRAAEQLAELGLTSFPMLSGGKRVHVIVPLPPAATWPGVKSFAERMRPWSRSRANVNECRKLGTRNGAGNVDFMAASPDKPDFSVFLPRKAEADRSASSASISTT